MDVWWIGAMRGPCVGIGGSASADEERLCPSRRPHTLCAGRYVPRNRYHKSRRAGSAARLHIAAEVVENGLTAFALQLRRVLGLGVYRKLSVGA